MKQIQDIRFLIVKLQPKSIPQLIERGGTRMYISAGLIFMQGRLNHPTYDIMNHFDFEPL